MLVRTSWTLQVSERRRVLRFKLGRDQRTTDTRTGHPEKVQSSSGNRQTRNYRGNRSNTASALHSTTANQKFVLVPMLLFV